MEERREIGDDLWIVIRGECRTAIFKSIEDASEYITGRLEAEKEFWSRCHPGDGRDLSEFRITLKYSTKIYEELEKI